MNIKTTEQIQNKLYDVLIIGAGMAGLSAAKVLEAQGLSVALVDKGRGLGGRLRPVAWVNFVWIMVGSISRQATFVFKRKWMRGWK